MAGGYRGIAEAVLILAAVPLPPQFLAEIELRCVNEFARVERCRRAAELLASIGATRAAEAEACSRATIYNRTHAHRRKSNETANS
jgi:hypothetical protein